MEVHAGAGLAARHSCSVGRLLPAALLIVGKATPCDMCLQQLCSASEDAKIKSD